ncbi:MAG: DEAD/DEAH box helicase [Tetrasphaera jenkinsii]|jgi:superfamily II DNA or RNA helicase|uniref:SNF2-like n=1 Tax=Nostocoides jenkinsii Ben 74 TaxID=1193518 RepID=A0A077M5E9_9MICO|nr:DEAD/DEAH box helicase [Tetrasphaera jenkinsii]MCI1261519.1 DEAD/DEAH box helicase [Tetrasphaera jenkinsii]CCI52491.1 SNF2-like [Tetrasphaera jenkinsii Ben 74]
MNSPLTSARWLADLTDERIQRHVGGATWARGHSYAQADMVRSITAADQGRVLLAEVEGTSRLPYQTLITVTSERTDSQVRWVSRCSCPMRADCKHTVAVLLAARAIFQDSGGDAPSSDWERLLAPLIDDEPTKTDEGMPLGLVVDLAQPIAQIHGGRSQPRVLVRPTRRTRAGWARNFTWGDITAHTPRVLLNKAHQSALKAIHDLYRVAESRDFSYYGYGDVFLGDLGPRIWPLLRAAVDCGVELLPGPNLPSGGVRLSADPVQVVLDVTQDGNGLTLEATLDSHVIGSKVHGTTPLGSPPHGFAIATADGLTLAPLDAPLDPRLAALLAGKRPVRVPPADVDRFLSLYLPRLRNVTRVESPDDSVVIPEQARPVLRIRLSQPGPTRLSILFDFAYAAPSGALLTRDLGPLPRHRFAEQSLLASLDVLDGIPGARSRANPASPYELADKVELRGMPVIRFIDDVLPELEFQPDIHITFDDELIAYEEASEAPLIDVGLSESSLGGTDWFDLGISVSVNGEVVPFEPLFRALVAGDEAMILDSGVWFRLDDPALDSLRQLISEARELIEPGAGMRISRYHVSLWDELASLGETTVDSAAWTHSVDRLRHLAETPPPPDPPGLLATLRPYQRDGFQWLHALWSADLGGVLADDMGLGKTLQTLALLENARAAGDLTSPVLVVAPTSVLGVWSSEAERFAPGLRVVVLAETARRRKTPLAEAIAEADLVVTSYAVARIDGDEFTAIPWRGLILDEAQYVKNHVGKTHQVLRKLTAPFRLAMTGTPLENSLMDLWSLLAIVAPGLYPRADKFTEFYRRPIESGESPEVLDRLRRRIKPLMLRRTKDMVATDLPEKQEQQLRVQLTPTHRRLYDQHLQRERQRVLGLLDDPVGNRVAILAALTRLRQLSLDPRLVDPEQVGSGIPAKIEILTQHLAELHAEGHRALVFSQFTGFLKLVQDHLDASGISTAYLDGATRNRASVVKEFKEGSATAFLISLKAGGVGLTLTEADYVFVLDPWWNPAAEAQAIDRAHRIGQDKMVMVYRLISADTIEEKVVSLQDRKRDLFNRVVDDGGSMSGRITADDIRALLEAD